MKNATKEAPDCSAAERMVKHLTFKTTIVLLKEKVMVEKRLI